jgi:chromosome segregation ATPase
MNNDRGHLVRTGLVLTLGACLALGGTAVFAQSKTAKEAQNLKKAADAAEQSITDVLKHVESMLGSYKKLANDQKATDKKIQNARKDRDSLAKQANKFFVQWEKELAEYSSDGMREKSSVRLEAAKEESRNLAATLSEASEAFEPLMKNLNDQILFLGRDLSPQAIAELQDEAAELNQQAEDVTATIKDLLAKADEQDAALEKSAAE